LDGRGGGDPGDTHQAVEKLLEARRGGDEAPDLSAEMGDLGLEACDAVLKIRPYKVRRHDGLLRRMELVFGLGGELVQGRSPACPGADRQRRVVRMRLWLEGPALNQFGQHRASTASVLGRDDRASTNRWATLGLTTRT